MTTKQTTPALTNKQKSKSLLRRLFPWVIVIIAVILAWPQPKLEWDDVLQLMSTNGKTRELPMEGTVVAITGATAGIGRGLALTLHRLGATVILLGRSPTKLDKLQQELGGDRTLAVVADLSDHASVARAAKDIASNYTHLDILINNAGMHYSWGMMDITSNPATVQGYDQVFDVNYLSHFLLTEKLLPLLQNGRIVNMASSFHMSVDGFDLHGSPPPASQNLSTFFHKERSYSNTKMAQILHVRSLNTLYPNITAVAVCPGWVGTGIGGPLAQTVLEHLAFPVHGWGVASTLHALVGTDDYVVNSRLSRSLTKLVAPLFFNRPWTVRTGVRDAVVWAFATIMLVFQKLDPGVVAAKSSPETYDAELQKSLYQWSQQAVAPFL